MKDIELLVRVGGEIYRLVPLKDGKPKVVRTCEHCERSFTKGRKDKRFCSGACRAAASREERGVSR